jgi:hypothetical protein
MSTRQCCTPNSAETALHWAASSDDVGVLDALLDDGADIEAPGAVFTGGSPMSDAVVFAQWRAARRLLECGALTTIWQAAALGRLDSVRQHVSMQPPPTREQITNAFWHACRGGQLAVAAYLFQHGANVHWIGHDNKAPLDVARESGVAALVQWLVGHTGSVRSAAFSPDGKTVVTGGDDKTARIWDSFTGKALVVLTGHADAVNDVAFSPDGKWLATASSDGSARLWDAATGKEVRQFLGHTGVEVRRLTTQATEVRDVAFSPDGKYVLTAGGNATARLWHTDYHDTIRYLCHVLTRDLTPDERTHYGIADDHATCRSE